MIDGMKLPVDKDIVLVRHGESTWNVEGRIQVKLSRCRMLQSEANISAGCVVQGNSDESTLTQRGEEQAKSVRGSLKRIPFDRHAPV